MHGFQSIIVLDKRRVRSADLCKIYQKIFNKLHWLDLDRVVRDSSFNS